MNCTWCHHEIVPGLDTRLIFLGLRRVHAECVEPYKEWLEELRLEGEADQRAEHKAEEEAE